ncbi:Cut8 six-helix bundle-domain-containing protein [Limtongia smithiae]|uniref:Cut8 six-helix bundle-domain-containing protein n=1 Tax=Limtongia smithiae TaxID=1125753 RepID=UPI0034CD5599
MSAVLPPAGPLHGFPFAAQSKEASSPPSPPVQSPQYPSTFRTGQKRKLSHDDSSDDEMACSPETSPALASRPIGAVPAMHYAADLHYPHHQSHLHHPIHSSHAAVLTKRARTELVGRPLSLARQLEPLDTQSLKQLLCRLAEKHVYLADEIAGMAPLPSVPASLELLNRYFDRILAALPYKGDPAGDYAYLRVRPHVAEFLDVVSDYTTHFLPPREQQAGTCLQFLDGVTALVHRLPVWTSEVNNAPKHAAYDELSRAWALAVREALKRANGIMLEYGGWREKIAKHDEQAGGRLHSAVVAVDQALASSPRRATRYF